MRNHHGEGYGDGYGDGEGDGYVRLLWKGDGEGCSEEGALEGDGWSHGQHPPLQQQKGDGPA